MEEIVVTGTASQGRTKFDSSVGISTFSSEEIAKQAPASTADLISAVPGFWVESTSGTTQGNVFARGIIQDGGYRYVGLMEDGIPIYPVFELSFYNPDQFVRVDETVERVEALRGGTAPIFTSGAVGGSINFVTRSPTEESEGSLKATVTDYDSYSIDGSWGGPLTEDWGLSVGGYFRKSDGIRDPGYTADEGGQIRIKLVHTFDAGKFEIFSKIIDDKSLFAVPIPLRGDPGDPTTPSGADPGTYSLHSADLAAAPLPPSASEVGLQGSNLEDGIHPELFTIGAKLNYDLNDTVTLSDTVRYTDGSVRFDGIFPGDAPVTAAEFAANRGVDPNFTVLGSGAPYDPNQLVQNHGHWVVNKEYEAIQNDLRLGFLLGDHDLTLGFYYADYSMEDRWSLGNLLLMDLSDQPNRLLLEGVTDPDGYTLYSFFNLAADYDAVSYALYLSDEWQVTDQLRLDFGVRYDDDEIDASVSNGVFNVDLDGDPATTFDIAALAGSARTNSSPGFDDVGYSIGFNFELNQQNALFGHYTDAAKLPHFDDVRNGVLRKDGVENIEFGYKASLDRVALFLTLFQTKFDNVPFNDILVDGSTSVRQAGTRTRGVELEGVIEPLEALAIAFTITQQDPEYTSFTGASLDNTGNQIRRIPKSMIRLTPTFYFADDRGRIYATWTSVGKRFSNDENTIKLPSYDKVDAGIGFDFSDIVSLQLNVDNLTDEVGLTEGNPRTDLGAGGIGELYNARPLFGRSYKASVTYHF
jgi:outer membrane receptor protein involved in Fe transport